LETIITAKMRMIITL